MADLTNTGFQADASAPKTAAATSNDPGTYSIPEMTDDLNIIAALPVNPAPPTNTAPVLQAKFDEAANKIQAYLNNTLRTAVSNWIQAVIESVNESIGAANERIDENDAWIEAEPQRVADYVAGKLTAVYQEMQNITLGQIPDHTITTDKLAEDVLLAENVTIQSISGLNGTNVQQAISELKSYVESQGFIVAASGKSFGVPSNQIFTFTVNCGFQPKIVFGMVDRAVVFIHPGVIFRPSTSSNADMSVTITDNGFTLHLSGASTSILGWCAFG